MNAPRYRLPLLSLLLLALLAAAPVMATADATSLEGNALALDGDDDDVVVSSFAQSDGAFTVEAWVRLNGSQVYSGIVTRDDGTERSWKLGLDNDGKTLRFDVFHGSGYVTTTGSASIADGRWRHVAGVYDGTDILLYVDGARVAQTALGGALRVSNAPLRFGNDACGTGCEGRFFNGELDEVRVWSAALDAATLTDWARRPVTADHPAYADLAAYYPLDETSGTTAPDASGNGRAGTVEGGAGWVRRTGSITVTPAEVLVAVDSTTQLSASVFDLYGDPVQNPTVTWASADLAMVTVDANGLITAGHTTGTVEITATTEGGIADTAEVTVGSNNPPQAINILYSFDGYVFDPIQSKIFEYVDEQGRSISNPNGDSLWIAELLGDVDTGYAKIIDNGRSIEYSPQSIFVTGVATVSYVITDGVHRDTAYVSWAIRNSAPEPQPEAYESIPKDEPFRMNLTDNDDDYDPLRIDAVANYRDDVFVEVHSTILGDDYAVYYPSRAKGLLDPETGPGARAGDHFSYYVSDVELQVEEAVYVSTANPRPTVRESKLTAKALVDTLLIHLEDEDEGDTVTGALAGDGGTLDPALQLIVVSDTVETVDRFPDFPKEPLVDVTRTTYGLVYHAQSASAYTDTVDLELFDGFDHNTVSVPIEVAVPSLTFSAQPPDTVIAGEAIEPAIRVAARDTAGNVMTGFTGEVTLTLGANPGGAALSGDTTVQAVGGVATFSALSLDETESGYALKVSAEGLLGAASNPFDVALGEEITAICTQGVATSVGASGARLTATLTSAPDADHCLTLYAYGSASDAAIPASEETLPDGISKRAALVWGVAETGSDTTDLSFSYGSVSGLNPANVRLLKREEPGQPWQDVTDQFTWNEGAQTFTATGVTDFSQFAVAEAGTSLSGERTHTVAGNSGSNGADAGWRFLSVPVSGVTVGDLTAQNMVQGIPGAFPGYDANLLTGYASPDFTSPDAISTTIVSGRGFFWYFFDNDKATSHPLPFELSVTGTPPAGDLTASGLAQGEQWHMLGNPYDEAIDLSEDLDLSANGFQTTVQVWDGSSYQEITAGTADDQIAPWTGFWAERTAVGDGAESLTFQLPGGGNARMAQADTSSVAATKTTSDTLTVGQVAFRLVATRDARLRGGALGRGDDAAGAVVAAGLAGPARRGPDAAADRRPAGGRNASALVAALAPRAIRLDPDVYRPPDRPLRRSA